MNRRSRIRATWFSWLTVSLLAVLCGIVAYLQYTWAGELSSAEQQRLQLRLRDRLESVRRGLNQDLTTAASGLMPASFDLSSYPAQYARWKDSHAAIFTRIALMVSQTDSLYHVDLTTGALSPGDARGGPRRPPRGGDEEMLIVEPNLDYARTMLLPELVERYLGQDYEVQIVTNPDGPSQSADAFVPLLEEPGRGGGRRGPPGPPPDREGRRGPPPPGNRSPRVMLAGQNWMLVARHKSGSLEALVEQNRRRNLAISAGLQLLILTTAAMLVRYARESQRLAELQFNFVAGVSHELRTPLTVIRTAAFNLHGKLAASPEHVERYGKLIAGESEKLTALVERVLLFARGKAGAVVRKRESVHLETLIGQVLASAGAAVETRIESDLPAVLGDDVALTHAFQNLVDNALKYGGVDHWAGIFASRRNGSVEIRVADHGPGIPPEEQARIFDPFFRGRRAIEDQIHGTGLGLDLVKTIVEAHAGTIDVESAPERGTEFIVRLPAAT